MENILTEKNNNTYPDWWKHAVIYHIYPKSFKDGNGDGLGDIPGVIMKLDYLASLGVDAIWLSPVYSSPMVDAGYDIADYKNIDKEYGTMEDFRCLMAEAHKRGIRIIMDLVLNHTSDQHPWFLESRSSVDSPKRNWYIWQAPKNGKAPNNWKTNFGKKAWHYDAATREYYYHSFFWQQPDLNWRNPEVKEAMFEIIRYWLDMGVDGFRLDVINMLFKDKELKNNRIGIFKKSEVYNRNQPEMYELLRDFRKVLDSYPHKTSVGEIYTPPPGNPALAASFLGNGSDMLHLVFDFSLVFSFWKASSYHRIINRFYKKIPATGWPCFFLSNHDIGRSLNRMGWTFNRYEKAKLHAILLLTLKGTPFIYYGDEIGMENVNIPKKHIKDLYGKMLYPFFKGRDHSRTPMQWNSGKNAGFSEQTPWLPVSESYAKINVETEEKDEYSVLGIYKKLLALRKEHPVLQNGDIRFINRGKKNILIYSRRVEMEEMIIVLNFNNKKTSAHVGHVGETSRIIFSTHCGTKMEKGEIMLQPFEGVLVKKGWW